MIGLGSLDLVWQNWQIFFFISLWYAVTLCPEEVQLAMRQEGAEGFVFEVSAPHDQLLWEQGDCPMCLSAQDPERVEHLNTLTP